MMSYKAQQPCGLPRVEKMTFTSEDRPRRGKAARELLVQELSPQPETPSWHGTPSSPSKAPPRLSRSSLS